MTTSSQNNDKTSALFQARPLHLRQRIRTLLANTLILFRYGFKPYRTIKWKEFTFTESRQLSYMQQLILNNQHIDKDIQCVARHISDSAPVCIDVGANIGMVSLMMSRIDNVDLHSFEPASFSFNLLKKNIEENHIDATLVNKGLSETPATMFIGPPSGKQHPRYKKKDGTHHGFFSVYADKDNAATSQHGEEAEFTTLDLYCIEKGIKKIDFIKIDTEGHEINVIRGGKKIIEQSKPIMKIEINKYTSSISGNTPEQLMDLLHSLGYTRYCIYDFKLDRMNDILPEAILDTPHEVIDIYAFA